MGHAGAVGMGAGGKRTPVRVMVVALVLSALALTSCGDDGDDTGDPSPGQDALADFTERCLEATEAVEPAQIRFDDSPVMQLGETTSYVLQISPDGTGDTELPPQGDVRVTCTIEARFVVSPQDAAVTPQGWEERRYLPPEPAEWAWLVTPQQPGDVEASLEVRPILVVDDDGISDTATYATERYPVGITVEQGLWDRVASLTAQAQAVLALLTALTALAVALGVRRWGPSLWHRFRGDRAETTEGP